MWPVGQAVKTPASHAGNGSSILPRVTNPYIEGCKGASLGNRIVRVDCDEGPPVPIPNTEVKLICADNTWRVTAREDR